MCHRREEEREGGRKEGETVRLGTMNINAVHPGAAAAAAAAVAAAPVVTESSGGGRGNGSPT